MSVILIGLAIAVTLLMPLLSLRSIDGDEHYGHMGFGSMTLSAANTFSVASLPAIAEPDLIISNKVRGNKLDIDIDDILVWDVREWKPDLVAGEPDITGGEGLIQEARGGITKDNTSGRTDSPTGDSVAQGTRAGGSGTSVTGGAGGATVPTQMAGDEVTRFEAGWTYWASADEEQTAVGQITTPFRSQPTEKQSYQPYEVDGITVHKLLTAAHYHLWGISQGLSDVQIQSLGGDVKRMSVDLQEMMFDREVLLSIVDALVVSS